MRRRLSSAASAVEMPVMDLRRRAVIAYRRPVQFRQEDAVVRELPGFDMNKTIFYNIKANLLPPLLLAGELIPPGVRTTSRRPASPRP